MSFTNAPENVARRVLSAAMTATLHDTMKGMMESYDASKFTYASMRLRLESMGYDLALSAPRPGVVVTEEMEDVLERMEVLAGLLEDIEELLETMDDMQKRVLVQEAEHRELDEKLDRQQTLIDARVGHEGGDGEEMEETEE